MSELRGGAQLGEGSFLVALRFGKADALGFEGLEGFIDPDVGSYQEGFCVKMVKGVLAVRVHSTPLFSYPRGADQVANEGVLMSIPSPLSDIQRIPLNKPKEKGSGSFGVGAPKKPTFGWRGGEGWFW